MKNIRIAIRGNKVDLIKALTALQNAKIDVRGIKVGGRGERNKKQAHRPYKLAEAYDDNY